MVCRKMLSGLGLSLAALMLVGCEQMNVDEQVAALCRQDGGIKVHEKVLLPREQLSPHGDPKFFKSWNEESGDYLFLAKNEKIKTSSPTIDKTTYTIVRESDGKTLGTYVSYLRRGGDILPRLGPESARACPQYTSDRLFVRTVFASKD
ncbi:MAG: hypothetical protein H6R04_643 [Burkholderiaceae bacterium]|nr:hypothetical protein [Burkholderiaceae bacterium]